MLIPAAQSVHLMGNSRVRDPQYGTVGRRSVGQVVRPQLLPSAGSCSRVACGSKTNTARQIASFTAWSTDLVSYPILRGVPLPDLGLPLALPVTVQVEAQSGECWEATYSEARQNDGEKFKAKSD